MRPRTTGKCKRARAQECDGDARRRKRCGGHLPQTENSVSESAGAGEIGRSDPLSDRSGAQLNQVGDERSTTE